MTTKNKDKEERPKKPLNAYFRFMQENKDTAKADGDFRNTMNKMWK